MVKLTKSKILLSSITTVIMCMVASHEKVAKAAELNSRHTAAHEHAAPLYPETAKPQQVKADSAQNAANQVEQTANSTSPTTEEVTTKSVSVKQTNIVKGTADSLQLAYDTVNNELTILGGEFADPSDGEIFEETDTSNSIAYKKFEVDGVTYDLKATKKINIVGKVKIISSIQALFADLPNLTEISGLENLEFLEPEEIYFNLLFANCTSLKRVDLSTLNVKKVCSYNYMFSNCTSLTDVNPEKLPFGWTFETKKMFYNCKSLTEISLNGEAIENVEDAAEMFTNCINLRKLDLSKFYTFAGGEGCVVTDMFKGLANLSTLILNDNTFLIDIDESSVGLDTPGTWINVGTGTLNKPEASVHLTSEELMQKYQIDFTTVEHSMVADTYVILGEPVTVHFCDTHNRKIADDLVLTGPLGDYFTVSPQQLPGYQLAADAGPHADTFTHSAQSITYTYSKVAADTPAASDTSPAVAANNDAAPITVQFIDENGQELAPKELITGKLGNSYLSSAKEIAGYKLSTRPDNATGFFTADPQTVTYVYLKNSTAVAQEGSLASNEGAAEAIQKPKQNRKMPSAQLALSNKQTLAKKKSVLPNKKGADQSSLPQTNANGSSKVAAFCLGFTALITSLAGAMFKSRKK